MTLKPTPINEIPRATAQAAKASFPKGNVNIKMRYELGSIYNDEMFTEIYSSEGQPGWSPWRLALGAVMQFAEDLSDRKAADAVRGWSAPIVSARFYVRVPGKLSTTPTGLASGAV
jgi:transposase